MTKKKSTNDNGASDKNFEPEKVVTLEEDLVGKSTEPASFDNTAEKADFVRGTKANFEASSLSDDVMGEEEIPSEKLEAVNEKFETDSDQDLAESTPNKNQNYWAGKSLRDVGVNDDSAHHAHRQRMHRNVLHKPAHLRNKF